jgi:hypothetical protein
LIRLVPSILASCSDSAAVELRDRLVGRSVCGPGRLPASGWSCDRPKQAGQPQRQKTMASIPHGIDSAVLGNIQDQVAKAYPDCCQGLTTSHDLDKTGQTNANHPKCQILLARLPPDLPA